MHNSVNRGMQPLAIGLSLLMVLPILPAQTLPTQLNIVVVQGEGAINNARQRVTREPIVRIEDENHKPLAGVAVVFTLPTEGATGEFTRGAKSLTIMSDSQGQAAAAGLKLNGMPGKVPIQVNVSYRGLTARTTITEISVLPPGAKASARSGGHGALIAVVVIAAAAAAGGGAYFATRKTSSAGTPTVTPPGPTPIGITPGTGTIVGGR